MDLTATRDPSQPWLTEGEEKRRAVQSMFARIAPGYDRMNRRMTANFDRAWRRKAVQVLQMQSGLTALDLCCGTGDFLPLLVQAGARAWGMDFCLPMLTLARSKSPASLGLADACCIPLRSGSVDVVTVGWGIRNVPDIDLAHREIARVIKPGGRFVSLDMAIPKNPLIRGISQVVSLKLLPLLGGDKEAYRYLPESARRFKSREDLAQSMEQAGFENVRYRDFAFGNVCMHWGVRS
ncbi:MAG: ubiquinone/menaquinone biosynthesis methyltransferase [Fimbriimonadaceae bacterium]|nr:ubiquinone/menaquinone biosynthesis methyltransferase [Fimbriimonadaceae bacterium]